MNDDDSAEAGIVKVQEAVPLSSTGYFVFQCVWKVGLELLLFLKRLIHHLSFVFILTA